MLLLPTRLVHCKIFMNDIACLVSLPHLDLHTALRNTRISRIKVNFSSAISDSLLIFAIFVVVHGINFQLQRYVSGIGFSRNLYPYVHLISRCLFGGHVPSVTMIAFELFDHFCHVTNLSRGLLFRNPLSSSIKPSQLDFSLLE